MLKTWSISYQSSRFPAQRYDLEPLTSDCLWASSCLTKDHEDFKRMAMNKSFPTTQGVILSVQRQVKTLIDRKDAKNMQILQDWKTFRWSRITLLTGLVSSDSIHIVCWSLKSRPIQHLGNKIGGCMENICMSRSSVVMSTLVCGVGCAKESLVSSIAVYCLVLPSNISLMGSRRGTSF